MKTKTIFPLLAVAAAAAVTASLALAGCSKESPVARVDVDRRELVLPFSQLQTIRLTWTPSTAIADGRPTVFVHLLDRDGKVNRTFDHPLPGSWREGVAVEDEVKLYQSALAPPLPPGKYQVTIGLYGKDGKRWPLDGLGEPVGRDEYKAFEVQVPNSNPSPRFAFAPTWMDLETGGDRQVVARRWLLNRAAIRLVDQHEPGAVWMVVQIPPSNLTEYKMILDAGVTTPAVLIKGNCGDTETNLTGSGLHEVRVNVEAPPADDFCHFLLTANFALQPQVPQGHPRSASLENIAWVPGGGNKATAPPAGDTSSTPTSPQ
jgi:hypothetical protein